MRLVVVMAVGLATLAAAGRAAAQQEEVPQTPFGPPPLWAYPIATPGGPPAPAPPEGPLRLPGTDATFTMAQVRNGFDVADWRPETHPAAPAVVLRGRAPDLRACGFCHYPNGQGRPENAGIAGLPAAYIVQQMEDFRTGARKSSDPRMGPPAAMIRVAQAAHEGEVWVAAEYFASMPFRPWTRVVESATAPVTVVQGGMHVPAPDGATEPIGTRIVEVPESPERTGLRDPASGFVAYVPPGSIARGETLVRTGGGRTTACGVCHGQDLLGLGPVPGSAGRAATYTARQLIDFRSGARNGRWAELMKGVVADLTLEDIVAIAAYTASRAPSVAN